MIARTRFTVWRDQDLLLILCLLKSLISNSVPSYALRYTYLACMRSLIRKSYLIRIIRWTYLIMCKSFCWQCVIFILTANFIPQWCDKMLASINNSYLCNCPSSTVWMAWWIFISLWKSIWLKLFVCI
jgi:hypothetical protein